MQNAKAQRRSVEHRNKNKYSDKLAANTFIKSIQGKYIRALEDLIRLEQIKGTDNAINKIKDKISDYRIILKKEETIK